VSIIIPSPRKITTLGKNIKIGYIVDLGGGMEGVVLIDVENHKFTDRFDMSVVIFLGDGIMIDTNKIGLLHAMGVSHVLRRTSLM
jgi:hypothetical protein